MKRRPFLTHMTALTSLAAAPVLLAQVKDVNDAINKAGRQRMLSQRMAKCCLALGQGVVADSADRNLRRRLAHAAPRHRRGAGDDERVHDERAHPAGDGQRDRPVRKAWLNRRSAR